MASQAMSAGSVSAPWSRWGSMTQWLDNVLADGTHAQRLRTDLEYFAQHLLKLRSKSGPLEPFIFNDAQRKLHRLIEEQKAKTGRVRVVVLKARQLGISTYIAGRYFHRTVHQPGLRTFILGHERRASSNLFQVVKRFYDNLDEEARPPISTSNAEELLFSRLDSGYIVTVANNDSAGAGRSATAQLLHASDAAFWDDARAGAAHVGATRGLATAPSPNPGTAHRTDHSCCWQSSSGIRR